MKLTIPAAKRSNVSTGAAAYDRNDQSGQNGQRVPNGAATIQRMERNLRAHMLRIQSKNSITRRIDEAAAAWVENIRELQRRSPEAFAEFINDPSADKRIQFDAHYVLIEAMQEFIQRLLPDAAVLAKQIDSNIDTSNERSR